MSEDPSEAAPRPATAHGPARDELELLAAARAGDRQALEALLSRVQPQVYRFGRRMCGDPQDAEDVLQETLLALARGVRELRGTSSLSTWLYTVARRFCLKKRRRRAMAPGGEAAELPDPAAGSEESLAGKEVAQALERAIRALPPPHREVLVLRDVEGLSAPEVAEILGISAQAVKSRLHRARVAVRDAVAPALGQPAGQAGGLPAGQAGGLPAASTTEAAEAAPEGCPDVSTLFSQHLEDELSAEVCREMERHLEGCARCRGACASLKQSLALCHAAGPEVEVPPAVQRAVRHALQEFLGAAPEPG